MTTPALSTAELGRRIRARRKSRGLSQERLGALAGCCASTVNNVEKDLCESRFATVQALLRALETTAEELMKETEKQ